MKRKLLRTSLLIIIPFLFLLLTLLFWGVWGPIVDTEYQSVLYSPTYSTTADLQRYFACYYDTNSTGYAPIEGLQECSILEANNATISCIGDESNIPVKGLCYRTNFNESFDSEYISTYGSFVPVLVWLQSVGCQLSIIPSLDEIIIFQWLTRKSIMSEVISNTPIIHRLTLFRSVSISCSGYVYFVGENVSDLIEYINNRSLLFKYVKGSTFQTLQEAQSAIKQNANNWAIIEVKSLSKEFFDVTLHVNASALPPTKEKLDLSYAGQNISGTSDIYIISGFLSLQYLIEEYYLQQINPVLNTSIINNNYTSIGNTSVNEKFAHLIANMGYSKYHIEQLLVSAVNVLPFIYVFAFLYPCTQLTKIIVEEKELRLREAMEIMGVRVTSLYVS